MDKLKMHSLNKVDDNIKKIGALFPNCVTERKNADGEVTEIATDSVITSVGYNPDPAFKKGGKVVVVGDAASVGNLRTVIWGVWDQCMKI